MAATPLRRELLLGKGGGGGFASVQGDESSAPPQPNCLRGPREVVHWRGLPGLHARRPPREGPASCTHKTVPAPRKSGRRHGRRGWRVIYVVMLQESRYPLS